LELEQETYLDPIDISHAKYNPEKPTRNGSVLPSMLGDENTNANNQEFIKMIRGSTPLWILHPPTFLEAFNALKDTPELGSIVSSRILRLIQYRRTMRTIVEYKSDPSCDYTLGEDIPDNNIRPVIVRHDEWEQKEYDRQTRMLYKRLFKQSEDDETGWMRPTWTPALLVNLGC